MLENFIITVDGKEKEFRAFLSYKGADYIVVIVTNINGEWNKIIEVYLNILRIIEFNNDENKIIVASLQFCKEQGYFDHIKEIMATDEPFKISF